MHDSRIASINHFRSTFKMASFKCTSHLVRRFTTTAVRNKLVTPPLQLFGVEGRYATALYSAATKQKQLDTVEKELTSFGNLLKTDSKLADFVYNPSLQRTEKKAILQKVVQNQKYSEITANFFNALVENGRLPRAGNVIKSFGRIMSAHRGEVLCTVTTASPLDAGSQKDLKAALQGFVKSGQTLQIEMKVDPSIMGGMVVNIGDKYVDMSTATKIRKYTQIIQQGI